MYINYECLLNKTILIANIDVLVIDTHPYERTPNPTGGAADTASYAPWSEFFEHRDKEWEKFLISIV